MSLKERFKSYAARTIQDHRRSWAVGMAARLARFVNNSWEYPSYAIDDNGERALLQSLSGEDVGTIFDVGANVGDWSNDCAKIFRNASIHSFEPVPSTYDVLAAGTAGQSRIRCHPFGLSDSDGTAEFTYYGPENSFLSTMVAPIHDHLKSSRVSIRLRRGDDVIRELAVPRVDLLKIDVEGMEYEVLEGLGETLAAGHIGFIQFEKQPGRRLLKDYYLLLGRHDYKIGKIYSRYVDFRPYDSAQERTAGPNYFAVPAANAKLISALQAGFSGPRNGQT
jgi:FkbM family methyltransferase